MFYRRLPLEKCVNVRDLGGYPAQKGTVTQFGRFLRGDALYDLSQSDLRFLWDYGVRNVFDLRGNAEKETEPNAFKGVPGVTVYDICLWDTEAYADTMHLISNGMGDFYVALADRYPENLGRLFTLMAECEGGVLFHCSAGKDRTGVTAALLLGLVGVAYNDIVANYQVSNTYIRVNSQRPALRNVPMNALSSDASYIEQFLDFIEGKGGAREFLKSTGVSETNLNRLAEKLVT